MSAEYEANFDSLDDWVGDSSTLSGINSLELEQMSFPPTWLPQLDMLPPIETYLETGFYGYETFDFSAPVTQPLQNQPTCFQDASFLQPVMGGSTLNENPRRIDVTIREWKYRPKRKSVNRTRGRPPSLSAEEVRRLKPLLERYFQTNQPLDDFLTDLEILHGIRVKQGPVRALLKTMGLRRNQCQSRTNVNIEQAQPNLGERRRPAKALPPRASSALCAYRSLSLAADIPRPRHDESRSLEDMFLLVGNYVKGHLDTTRKLWAWDEFGVTYAAGAANYSDLWKTIADQCHGASSLIQTKHQLKAFKTIQKVYQRLATAAQQHDPWVAVYIWKILLYIRGISDRLRPPYASFVKRFIRYLWRLYFHLYSNTIPLVRLLALLNEVPLKDLKMTLGLLYKRSIHEFEKYGNMKEHPVVLRMWSHYHSHFPGEFRIEALEKYQGLATSIIEGQNYHSRGLLVVSDYMLAAYRERGNLSLAEILAGKLIESIDESTLQTWSSATYCYVVASKYLARVLWDREDEANCWEPLRNVVEKLRTGDRECRTRAAQVQETIARRYSHLRDAGRAKRERDIRDDILNTIKGWPADQSPWGGCSGLAGDSEVPNQKKKLSRRERRRRQRLGVS